MFEKCWQPELEAKLAKLSGVENWRQVQNIWVRMIDRKFNIDENAETSISYYVPKYERNRHKILRALITNGVSSRLFYV